MRLGGPEEDVDDLLSTDLERLQNGDLRFPVGEYIRFVYVHTCLAISWLSVH